MVVYTFEQRLKVGLRSTYRRYRFWQKKSRFQMKLILILAGMQPSKIVAFGVQKTRTHTLISRHIQNASGIIEPFFFSKMSKERPLESMSIVIELCWKHFYSQKFKSWLLATFGFNMTALHVTHPKLHSMFGALYLKTPLSAAELMSFGHLRAAVWHRWTIFVGCH